MDRQQRRWSPGHLVVASAIAVGVAAGSYGVASAASGSGASSNPNPASPSSAASSGRQPWGHQRSDETTLTGDAAAKVRALALAKVSGGTIIRVETDADGNAAYEAHMVKADGTPVTVYVNKQFEVMSVQSGMAGPGRPHGNSSNSSGASA